LLGALVLATTAVSLAGGGATPASASQPKGSSGSFTFSGPVSGKLKVPGAVMPGGVTACSISPSQGGTDVIVWNSAKLSVSGKPKKLNYAEIQIEVSQFGKTYSMVPHNGTSLGTVFLSVGKEPYQWTTDTGTVTTAKNGKSGSVNGSMTVPAGGSQPGTVTIKGSWAGCSKLAL
jgi:hypothetical protein